VCDKVYNLTDDLDWAIRLVGTCRYVQVLRPAQIAAQLLIGTNGSLAGSLITGVVALWHPDVTIQRWQIYVVYAGWIGTRASAASKHVLIQTQASDS
jgi:hypothetical protein